MIYERIKAVADKKGMTIAEVEKAAHLANGLIAKWREAVPSVINLAAVARVLEVPITDLYELDEQQ